MWAASILSSLGSCEGGHRALHPTTQEGHTIYKDACTRPARLSLERSHANHRAEEETHSSDKYLQILEGLLCARHCPWHWDTAVDKTAKDSVLEELTSHGRGRALNTEYKMKIISVSDTGLTSERGGLNRVGPCSALP